MNAGDLRHRVTIERPDRATDPRTGQAVPTWSAVATVWAAVRPRSAGETEQAKQTVHTVTHEVRLRYTADLTADCRLVLNGRRLNVVSVVNVDERDRELRVQASEATAHA